MIDLKELENTTVPKAVVSAIKELSETAQGSQTVTDVTSPHTVGQNNNGAILVFNDASDAVLNIPDGLNKGTAVIAVNVGAGSIAAAMTGTETARGSLTLADGDSYMSLVKITDSIYQSSEA